MKRGGNGWNSRRVLIDVNSTPSTPSTAAATAAPSEATHDQTYEEQSIFIPNQPSKPSAALNLTVASSSNPAAALESTSTSTGLAGLLSYSDSDDEDGGEIKKEEGPIQHHISNTPNSSPPSSVVELPDGWVAMKDEASGDTYYWNETTDATSWDPPTRVERQTDAKINQMTETATSTCVLPGSAESSAAVSALPPGWSEVVDPTTQDKYYWHEATDQTTWDRPKGTTGSKSHDMPAEASKMQLEHPSPLVPASVSSSSNAAASASSFTSASTTANTPSSLLINALLTGVNLRLRSALSVSVTPISGLMTLEQSISPLMQLVVQLRICEQDWSRIQSNTGLIDADVESKLLLRTLQRITVDIDSVFEQETSWRKEHQIRDLQVMDKTTNAIPSSSTSPPDETTIASAPVPPPPRSGLIHPSRLGVVTPVVAVGAPAVHHAENAKKRERTEDHAAALDGGASKKLKKVATSSSAVPSILQTSVGGLISKWKAVSEAAEEEAAAKKKERKMLQQAIDDSWKTSPSNANMIPVGDWRAKIASQQHDQ